MRRAAPDSGHAPGGPGVFAVAAVTLADGGDNIGVYVPVFATSAVGGLLTCHRAPRPGRGPQLRMREVSGQVSTRRNDAETVAMMRPPLPRSVILPSMPTRGPVAPTTVAWARNGPM